MTFEGGGSVAPALRQSSSQISNRSASTTAGGTTFTATALRRAASLLRSALFGSASATTLAGVGDGVRGTALSVLIIGMVIGIRLRLGSGRSARAGGPCFQFDF